MTRYARLILVVALIFNTGFTTYLMIENTKLKEDIFAVQILSNKFTQIDRILDDMMGISDSDRAFLEIFHRDKDELIFSVRPHFSSRVYSVNSSRVEETGNIYNQELNSINNIDLLMSGICIEDPDIGAEQLTIRCPIYNKAGNTIGAYGVVRSNRTSMKPETERLLEFYGSQISELFFTR